MRSLGILPEFEIFDAGMLAGAERVYEDHGGDHHRHYDFVLGVSGGLPAWPDSIAFLLDHLPKEASWSATGIGRAHLGVATEAIDRGGHVRTGFEDVRYFESGQLAESNRRLIERVVQLARAHGREVATPSQARHILRLG
jgi:3-keto-5-aminohexanoate cleavage enzyme